MTRWILAALLVVACSKHSGGGSTAAPAGGGKIAAPDTLHKLCTGQWGGQLASVKMYRDAQGIVKVLEMQPDISKIADAPSVFFDPSGKQIGQIGNHPVTPGSADQQAADKQRQDLVGGLTAGETVSCGNVH
jgi:hypothetical protein